ncbi:MAG: hypothetical protein K9L68_14640 [Spirochaetales bacterium]|nr:hypothetical protein [Spirochaetales bacterium]
MPLVQEDYAAIGEYVRTHLSEWLSGQSPVKPPVVHENEYLMRMTRIEEELKYQRDLMKQGFELMEKRFEQVDKRFEQVNKRFEQVERRFEQVDQRFESLTRRIDRFMIWSFGLTVTMAGVIIAVLKWT